MFGFVGGVKLEDNSVFSDDSFRDYLSENFDADGDGELDGMELWMDEIDVTDLGVESLKGIENFPFLMSLKCANNALTELDVSANVYLSELDCANNNIKTLIFNNELNEDEYIYGLMTLTCSNNQLEELDVTKQKYLTGLTCDGNKLTALDVTKNGYLYQLYCYSNDLSDLDVTQNVNLRYLACHKNDIEKLDLKSNPRLTMLACNENRLAELDVTANENLTTIYCSSNDIETLNLESNPNLQQLYCVNNKLTALDVTGNGILVTLNCARNEIKALDLTGNIYLMSVDCSDNNITGTLDVSKSLQIAEVDCYNNKISELKLGSDTINGFIIKCNSNDFSGEFDVSAWPKLRALFCYDNKITALNVSENPELVRLSCGNNNITGTLDLSKNTKLTDLLVYSNDISAINFGESEYPVLAFISCYDNKLEAIDLSKMPALDTLICFSNDMKALDTSGNPELVYLGCSANKLASLNVTKSEKLETLTCGDNKLTELDISKNTALVHFSCNSNDILTLTTAEMPELVNFDICNNIISKLDVTGSPNLLMLLAANNYLRTLDVTQNPELLVLSVNQNGLETIDLSKNTHLLSLDVSSNDIATLDLSANSELIDFTSGTFLNTLSVDLSGRAAYPYRAEMSKYVGADNVKNIASVQGYDINNSTVATEYQKDSGTVYLASGVRHITYEYDVGYTGDVEEIDTMPVTVSFNTSNFVLPEYARTEDYNPNVDLTSTTLLNTIASKFDTTSDKIYSFGAAMTNKAWTADSTKITNATMLFTLPEITAKADGVYVIRCFFDASEVKAGDKIALYNFNGSNAEKFDFVLLNNAGSVTDSVPQGNEAYLAVKLTNGQTLRGALALVDEEESGSGTGTYDVKAEKPVLEDKVADAIAQTLGIDEIPEWDDDDEISEPKAAASDVKEFINGKDYAVASPVYTINVKTGGYRVLKFTIPAAMRGKSVSNFKLYAVTGSGAGNAAVSVSALTSDEWTMMDTSGAKLDNFDEEIFGAGELQANTDTQVFFAEKSEGNIGSSGGGGCDAGFGAIALALAAVMLRKGRNA